ncbi:GH36-type glycosyl hydrolase domain-containing protein [Rhodoferax antarcticus]|uniref:Glycosyltransferase 36 family protein n=1 Tax=Rhodoferax antarcticus ANT.BR TaxID=1111071 RepID=A0A1Q8YA20_9BURK|nr:glucoamylase family protein [Rhodoferax antarcticus]OLP04862.1 glycosyltransferase 36 family protein [Rhodoferax antarcticus ANT.BR]
MPATLQSLLSDAPPALRDILDSQRGPVQAPIRSEIFGPQRFAQHGRSLAVTHRAAHSTLGAATFFPRLQGNIAALRQAHGYIGTLAGTGYDISPAAEWLLDNFHLVETQLKEIRKGLPPSYYRSLPVLLDEPLAGLPRIYGVAWAFVAHTDGAFDETLLIEFLRAYEEERQLNLSEMWALPTTLRVVLVENLRRLAESIAAHKGAREAANLCFDEIDTLTVEVLEQLLALLYERGVGHVFLLQFGLRLQDHRLARLDGEQAALHTWLQNVLPDLAMLQTQQAADQAADNLSVSNAVTSLRAIGDADWPEIIASTSTLMRLMLTQPVFEAEDNITRDHSLHAIEHLARQSGHTEVVVAQRLLGLMAGTSSQAQPGANPAHWLLGLGKPDMLQALGLPTWRARAWLVVSRQLALPFYLGTLSAVLALLMWLMLRDSPQPLDWSLWLLGLLAVFPASEAVVAVINRLISESVKPQHLARLALTNGIPPEHRVLVVIPGMLSSATSATELAHQLHLHYLANPEHEAQFALLTDFSDAGTAQLPGDADLLASAVAQIQALNARHASTAEGMGAPRFVLLHRERQFSDTEQRWIGWERKRGKLEMLISALATGSPSGFIDLGDNSRLAGGVTYVLTLDSDTQLPPGRLRELVGVAAHPQNQPKWDANARRVVAGYGILQPRVATPLPDVSEFTRYHWLFAGQCGMDPYSAASSEVYQDVFAEGTFTGKGLLHVQAMHAVLANRLPDGQVLSHDLLEGSVARCAAVTDISVIEDAPFHADVAASRVHRWTRGDWQLLPFMLQPKRYGLSAIHVWKMTDNLRRSLVAPMSLGLLLLTLAGSVMSPWTALLLVLAAFSGGPLMGALAGLAPGSSDIAMRHFYREALTDLARAVLSGIWLLAELLQHAKANLDAISRALYRTLVSKRHLLQWTTAAAAQAQAKSGLAAIARQHWREPVLALALLVVLLFLPTPTPVLATLLCFLWGASPVWTWWVSRVSPRGVQEQLCASDHNYLQGVARDTWRLFERCVGPEDHHLPPDNLQVLPHDLVAHRTSPTNIGMYLLSTACARQFGWIGMQDFLARLEATLSTLQGMQRHRGHFMNWYDTQTAQPMLPMYVSAVDSGNLSGHLLAVAEACLEFAETPDDGGTCQAALNASKARLMPLVRERRTLSIARREELKWLLADHRNTRRSAQRDTRARSFMGQSGFADAVQARSKALSQALATLAWEADFQFLYSRKRHLLHIGYRVAERQLDAGFYDLLASESRLTSLLGIARGDLPVRHWAHLGRAFFARGTDTGLRSWSGSMFEYMMPSLVLKEPLGSVLCGACHTALLEQMDFSKAHGVPWGISESAYAASDYTLAYQYSPQGVPRLALRRTPPDELVIAPYATALAALLAPQLARQNYNLMQNMGARGRYGFIEALDFTQSRRVGAEPFVPVATFMAHHQGMTIVALANVLLAGTPQRWGMANAHLQAVSSLLHERIPRAVSSLYAPPVSVRPLTQRRRSVGMLREIVPGNTAIEPTHLLSNGRYSVTLRANGAGSSSFEQIGITRTRDDALRDDRGSFFYLRRAPGAGVFSMTQHPAPDPGAKYSSVFHADRICLNAAWDDLQATTTVWTSPEDDIEFRQVELRNTGTSALDLELLSAFEVALADARADEAHPAFSNLFVSAHWLASHQALLMERKPRLATEQGLRLAHFLTDSRQPIGPVRLATDRQAWQGRNRAASQPLAQLSLAPATPTAGAEESSLLDTGLDPVCALSVALHIAPGATARITFATAVSRDADVLRAVIDKYRLASNVQRASLMSATLAGIRLRGSRINADNFNAIQTLTSTLVMSLSRSQARAVRPQGAAAEVCDRRLLWRFGISGDRPIVLVLVSVAEGLGLIRALSQALGLWLWGNVPCDLVVINAEPASYLMTLDHEIAALRDRHTAEVNAHVGPASTRLHLLRADDLTHPEINTLHSLARVMLRADGRPFTHHVSDWLRRQELALARRRDSSRTPLALAAPFSGHVSAAQGAFAPASADFSFLVSARQRPPRPWINVLANADFGAHLSEAGGGYTWALNSRLNQLTGWSNDALSDPPSEWFLLQNTATREVWSVCPGAGVGPALSYQITHGQGFTQVQHRYADMEVTATWCVDSHTSIKQIHITLVNHGTRTLRLRVIGIAEWLMGANRSDRGTVRTAMLNHSGQTALLATQRELASGFGDGTAFLSLSSTGKDAPDWTCDRRECFNSRGRLVLPESFDQNSGDGLDPCAALATPLMLAAGQSEQCRFLLGFATHADQVPALLAQAAALPADARLAQVRAGWDRLLGATTVKTPDPLLDALVNRWLLYQTVSCRLWAKSGFYQAGGATGFRDQLQDAMALAWAAPDMLREQIVLHASRQFVQGDVQHWWHAPTGVGVRTHFSDDRLWLVLACTRYLQATGDASLLDAQVPFLEGNPIPAGAEDIYETPTISAQSATVYEHAARTLDRSMALGSHNLPLMGSGDWNDGMNRIGIEGRGESVWLGWFLCRLIADFAPLAQTRGDAQRAARWQQTAQTIQSALSTTAWDGEWFKRAYFDDGQPLGSKDNTQGRIDLIAQAWAVLSAVAPPALAQQALASSHTHLVDPVAGLIKLLDPPLTDAVPSAGYIQAYPPGVRENGGQYNHAGIWALMAQAQAAADGDGDTAYRYFTYLSPAHRASHPTRGPVYGLEPYVMAADVYTQPPYVGRGGWSWYTGAAAWLHRAAIESILGLTQEAQTLAFQPRLPSHWPQAELTLVRGTRTMRFILMRASPEVALQATAKSAATLLLPGQALNWSDLPDNSCFVIPL